MASSELTNVFGSFNKFQNNFSNGFSDLTLGISTKISSASSDISDTFSSATSDISNTFTSATSDISNSLNSAASGISNSITTATSEFSNSVSSATSGITDTISSASSTSMESLKSAGSKINSDLNAISSGVNNKFNDGLTAMKTLSSDVGLDNITQSEKFQTASNMLLPKSESSELHETSTSSKSHKKKCAWCHCPRIFSCQCCQCSLCSNLSYAQRVMGFGLFLIGGLFMLSLSTMYIMQALVGHTAKFAMCYTLSNVMILSSSCFLVGPSKQLKSMCTEIRIYASLIYITSMAGTLYLVWKMPYIYFILPMVVLQFSSLLWYVASYIPYGQRGLQLISKVFRKIVGGVCSTCWKLCICRKKKKSLLPL